MAARSKAAEELKRLLRPPPPVMNQTRLAEKLGVSQQAVSSWLKGRALPEPERMAAIEGLLGIPMRDWVLPGTPTSADESAPSLPASDDDDDDDEEDRPGTSPVRRTRGPSRGAKPTAA